MGVNVYSPVECEDIYIFIIIYYMHICIVYYIFLIFLYVYFCRYE